MKGFASLRALVVDDEFLVATEIARTLQDLRFGHIDVAADGAEALRRVQTDRPDVVLMDIRMPVMDGLEASKQIRESWPTAVVLMSAFEDDDLIEAARRAGVSAYLTKPPAPSELKRAITIAVEQDRRSKRLERRCRMLESRKKALERKSSEGNRLKGLILMCSHCKKVREQGEGWAPIEAYIGARAPVQFSYGVCPACMKERYPEAT